MNGLITDNCAGGGCAKGGSGVSGLSELWMTSLGGDAEERIEWMTRNGWPWQIDERAFQREQDRMFRVKLRLALGLDAYIPMACEVSNKPAAMLYRRAGADRGRYCDGVRA